MNAETIFRAWAGESLWSPWVKPVLFAHLSPSMIASASARAVDELLRPDLNGIPRASGTAAVLVDLPGAASVATGLALAEAGYRPVPLYNAVPVTLPDAPAVGSEQGARAAVEMSPIVDLIVQGAGSLALTALSAHAPPAFLLDSRRRGIGAMCEPGDFDNRSISLPTDFPSVNFMLANRIRDAIVIQEQEGPPQQDLAHTLRRWQEGGMRVFTSVSGGSPRTVFVSSPPRFRHMWYGFLARLGLRQNPLGGFGGFLPVPSAG